MEKKGKKKKKAAKQRSLKQFWFPTFFVSFNFMVQSIFLSYRNHVSRNNGLSQEKLPLFLKFHKNQMQIVSSSLPNYALK